MPQAFTSTSTILWLCPAKGTEWIILGILLNDIALQAPSLPLLVVACGKVRATAVVGEHQGAGVPREMTLAKLGGSTVCFLRCPPFFCPDWALSRDANRSVARVQRTQERQVAAPPGRPPCLRIEVCGQVRGRGTVRGDPPENQRFKSYEPFPPRGSF